MAESSPIRFDMSKANYGLREITDAAHGRPIHVGQLDDCHPCQAFRLAFDRWVRAHRKEEPQMAERSRQGTL